MTKLTRVRCKNCFRIFNPNPKVKNQRYCSSVKCQRARKSLWQKNKMKTDPDYKLNQNEAVKNWREKNPDYYKEYRSNNPEYTSKNRRAQKNRNDNRIEIAKMDTLIQTLSISPGSYYITPAHNKIIAKMDASPLKIHIIPDGYDKKPFDCKKGLDGQQHVT